MLLQKTIQSAIMFPLICGPNYSDASRISGLLSISLAAVFVQSWCSVKCSIKKVQQKHICRIYEQIWTRGRLGGLPDYQEMKHSHDRFTVSREAFIIYWPLGFLFSISFWILRTEPVWGFQFFNTEIIKNIKKELFWAGLLMSVNQPDALRSVWHDGVWTVKQDSKHVTLTDLHPVWTTGNKMEKLWVWGRQHDLVVGWDECADTDSSIIYVNKRKNTT